MGVDFRFIKNWKQVGSWAINTNIIVRAARYADLKLHPVMYGWINDRKESLVGGRVVEFTENPPSYTRCVRFINGIPKFA